MPNKIYTEKEIQELLSRMNSGELLVLLNKLNKVQSERNTNKRV